MRATAAWIEGTTDRTAARDVGAVLSVAADAAGDDLMRQVLLQLPAGCDLLFGRPDSSDHSAGSAHRHHDSSDRKTERRHP